MGQPIDFHIRHVITGQKQKKAKQVDEDGDVLRKIHYKQRKLNRPNFSHEDDDQII